MAWGYVRGNSRAHPHCRAFLEWCAERGVQSDMPENLDMEEAAEDVMMLALTAFEREVGDQAFGELFREVFLGGEERIRQVAASLQRLQAAGVDFAIITRGTSAAVLRGLVAVPEWLPFFPSSHVWDTSQNRHRVGGSNAQKSLMLRDLCPTAAKILLVDDSLSNDAVPDWVLKAAGVEVFGLPYEGPGVSEEMLKEIEEIMLR